MKMTCTRKIEFDTAHRLMNHEGKCATLHGHRYVAELTAEGAPDQIGRVVDFSVIKEKIGGWIDEKWDHNCIIYKDDIETIKALKSIPHRKDLWVSRWNPTAENMAYYILKTVAPELMVGTGVKITKVRLYETPNCYAEVSLG